VTSRAGTVLANRSIVGGGKLALTASLGASKVALTGLGTAVSAFGGLAAHLIIDAMFDGFINWSKYRQPIMFYPLTRLGQAWYAAMEGFKNNSAIEHISEQFGRTATRGKFYWETASKIFNEYVR